MRLVRKRSAVYGISRYGMGCSGERGSKIVATIENAKQFLIIQAELCSFSDYLWSFVGGAPIVNHWQSLAEVPAHTAESDKMSKALKKRGFKFVGSTICYAFMQAAGLVNDHITTCHRYKAV